MQRRRERRRRERSKGERQEQALLDAAVALLAERRFDDLNVADVAEAAQTSRPSVYFYFASMQDLLVALVRRELSGLISSLEQIAIPDGATPVSVLEQGLRRTGQLWREHYAVLRAAVENSYRVPGVYEQWRGFLARGIDLYVALMTWAAELDDRSAPDDADARRRAELCMLMVGHAFHDHHESRADAEGSGQLEQDLLAVLTRALELGPA